MCSNRLSVNNDIETTRKRKRDMLERENVQRDTSANCCDYSIQKAREKKGIHMARRFTMGLGYYWEISKSLMSFGVDPDLAYVVIRAYGGMPFAGEVTWVACSASGVRVKRSNGTFSPVVACWKMGKLVDDVEEVGEEHRGKDVYSVLVQLDALPAAGRPGPSLGIKVVAGNEFRVLPVCVQEEERDEEREGMIRLLSDRVVEGIRNGEAKIKQVCGRV